MSDQLPVRRFSDEEVAAILKRATEIRSESTAVTRGSAEGLTLGELEEIAGEAGINVAHVRQAAMELDGPPVARSSGDAWYGDTRRLLTEITVPGRIPEEKYRRVVDAIEMALDDTGSTSTLGGGLTWRSDKAQGKTRLTTVDVGPDGEGSVRIRIDENLEAMAGSLHGGITWGGGLGIGMGIAMPVSMSLGVPILALGILASTVGGGYALARTLYKRHVAKRRKVVANLMRRLVELVEPVEALPPGGETRAVEGGGDAR
jgi:hypothetical protein